MLATGLDDRGTSASGMPKQPTHTRFYDNQTSARGERRVNIGSKQSRNLDRFLFQVKRDLNAESSKTKAKTRKKKESNNISRI